MTTRLSDFDYPLPFSLIAKYPAAKRDHARMMVLNRDDESWEHQDFFNFPEYLHAGDLLILNNTRVLPARLIGHRLGYTGKVELLLLRGIPGENGQDGHSLVWHTLMKPKRRLKPGTVIAFAGTASTAVVEPDNNTEPGEGIVRFQLQDEDSVYALMEKIGQMPIPPYLNRQAEAQDKEDYQTVFAKTPGSQAAPTAGLHFTPEVLRQIEEKGVHIAEVTLHVSTGTFRGVYEEDITKHRMDPEYYEVSASTVEAIRRTKRSGGKVYAVGTTAAKTLETVACKHGPDLQADSGWSELFIRPGFEFKVLDGLLTNFHLPKTTLMMLVSAFANREFILAAYEEAIQAQYRFFSYGDCMLIR